MPAVSPIRDESSLNLDCCCSQWGLRPLLIASGCQVSTHTGMYRGFVNWRRFREPILVLERAPLSDEEPSLWDRD